MTLCSYFVKTALATLLAMIKDIAPFGLRIPGDLKEALSKSAADNNRSMNSEIVHRLEKSFNNDSFTSGDREKLEGTLKAMTESFDALSQYITEVVNK